MKFIYLAAILIAFSACSTEQNSENATLSVKEQQAIDDQMLGSDVFKLGQFHAKYYEVDNLIHAEVVDEVAIDSSHDKLHGISPEKLKMVWEGTIDVLEDQQVIDIRFDLSWAKVKVFIDDETVIDVTNSHKSTSHLFSKGKHQVRVEFENNWHTVDFHLWFTQRAKYTITQAEPLVRPLVVGDVELAYVGIYGSNHPKRNVYIAVEKRSKPLFLFLASYESVHYKVIVSPGASLKGVVFNSHNVAGNISANVEVPMLEVSDFTRAYKEKDMGGVKADIKRFSERYPDKTFFEYRAQHVRIFP